MKRFDDFIDDILSCEKVYEYFYNNKQVIDIRLPVETQSVERVLGFILFFLVLGIDTIFRIYDQIKSNYGNKRY